jgi:hypothetical protein
MGRAIDPRGRALAEMLPDIGEFGFARPSTSFSWARPERLSYFTHVLQITNGAARNL